MQLGYHDHGAWPRGIGFGLACLIMGFVGAPLWLWSGAILGLVIMYGASYWVFFAVLVVLLVFNIYRLRRLIVTRPILAAMERFKIFPKISITEKEALKAGDVWVERELFSGKPSLDRLRKEPYPELASEEKQFINVQVEEACRRVKDWDVWTERDLPDSVWEYLKKELFFGMIIPKEYGGLGFSALAHSSVIEKLNSRSIPLAITVMVPNSLGPAKLLIEYGTQEQRDFYLPRLARGEEIPCFALTEPNAGSDAAAIQSNGILFRGEDQELYLKLNWNKRWITLSTVATVIGLAFQLKDPEQILGKGIDIGITCALVPANTPGVQVDRRHDPLSVPFYNSPIYGRDVVLPASAIIGGIERAGQGWAMLMAALAEGRGISLPAQSTGGVKLVACVASAHAVVRRQFGVSIGKFEGIAEPLAEIFGFTYLLEAVRRYTCGALDQGLKPPIVTAIAKYHSTEIARRVINKGMDIRGGAGITLGPRNLLSHLYIATPISITVEGANILTRTLMIFGQGALRAHPYAFQELESYEKNDLIEFDRAFWGHFGNLIRNSFRAFLLSISRGYLAINPVFGPILGPKLGPTARYYRKIFWSSACFSFMADIAMICYGGRLKSKEAIAGRFSDILSWMFIGTAALRRFEAEGQKAEDWPLLQWSMNYALTEIQGAFEGIFTNFEVPCFQFLFKGPLYWFTRMNSIGRASDDRVKIEVSKLAQTPGAYRDKLLDGMYMPKDSSEQLYRLDDAFKLTVRTEPIEVKIRQAIKEGKLKKKVARELYRDALDATLISQFEYNQLLQAERKRDEVIQVDDFSFEEYYKRSKPFPVHWIRKF